MLAESIDHSPPPEASNRVDETPSLEDNHRARILRIDQDEARLTTQGCTWYEIKASTLRQSDISYVKDKAGITSLYEVVIPPIHARAHRPPAGFHTFYINQIDRGLRFPLPTFIASLCHYIGVSPSQLAPNSYSSLLSLAILLKFHGVPLSTYVLMQLVTIKRLGPGKFYISNKKEFRFIGGNPSSHKGWMSRYFFIRRISGRENFWGCDMSWQDNAHTLPPSPPEQKPNLTKFLEAMRGKCFNAQQLIEEDLLRFFNFSGKKARLIGNLGKIALRLISAGICVRIEVSAEFESGIVGLRMRNIDFGEVNAGQSYCSSCWRACARALKRRRLIKWKRYVLSFAFKRSAAGSKACVAKVTSFGLVDASSFCVISRNQQIDSIRERAVSSS
ncbi:hypothetical protein F511_42315 [Dorcoceras hygrometricum]|uniref:Uncharacterized protein n=1 Tax=Dorcoceras hygrometricum TaxID=472368 RepID=A0A2Z7AB51_9LAMI|nr:hypothetical protein F511_42315 [Dorcoceras hygrometricum]